MQLPADHALRHALNREIHARPPEALKAPCALSYVVLMSPSDNFEQERSHVAELVKPHGLAPPSAEENHYSVPIPGYQLKWERHTEFSRYLFIVTDMSQPLRFGDALDRVDPDWLAALPGELLFAAHCNVLPQQAEETELELVREVFGDTFVGSDVSGGSARSYTDFELDEHGFDRFIVFDHGTNPLQLGRIVQRLLEIATYWILSLLALPAARTLGPYLSTQDAQLQRISAALANTDSGQEEAELLSALIELEAELSRKTTELAFRFGASDAYYHLVERRILDLREIRLPGLQTFSEFAERRLAPAMNTCQAAQSRLAALIDGTSRATRLLATRVSSNQELQNQSVLESMNRRVKLQLRLQQTVEGLSVAAITYYIVGLVNYLGDSLEATGLLADKTLLVGGSIPVVLLTVGFAVRSVRNRVSRDD